ncbi:melanocortin-2 receptor accessory protein 2A-like isoform X2 [Notolabrus celidotus]|nr:melanocortin-2 receptor accessory protein 2A-like isoform X2 [Notolabrus celidotus]XP_034553533.1 melanocortin-2 receptor accessory protein 2A-like isoform X2 [Notolabrus celidotus]XP_034553534.1 melanocortin-2 receptor accessory protein 2A-like isoform X2 [Notolabrus celidotus]
MSHADGPNGTGPPPPPDYEWRYEYYDEEELVSFEGLKVHRYSIAIGFWVGLAVFVIFMFFLLTLLIKTGAPQPEGQLCEKPPRVIGYVDATLNVSPPSNPPGADSSCCLLCCCDSEMDAQGSSADQLTAVGGVSEGVEMGERVCALLLQELKVTERENDTLAHFDVPNCVNAEAVEENELLLEEPELSIILEGRDQS